jgi:hypothetical protein
MVNQTVSPGSCMGVGFYQSNIIARTLSLN